MRHLKPSSASDFAADRVVLRDCLVALPSPKPQTENRALKTFDQRWLRTVRH